MAIALLLTTLLVPFDRTASEAAVKPKFSTKKITVTEGKTKKLTVKNAKGGKLTWKVKNKKNCKSCQIRKICEKGKR